MSGSVRTSSVVVRPGEFLLTPEQAELLSHRVGLSPADILAANPVPPEPLCVLLDLPRHRPKVDRLAAQLGIDEAEAHRIAAYGSWALAARQTGAPDGSEWERRVEQYFSVALDE